MSSNATADSSYRTPAAACNRPAPAADCECRAAAPPLQLLLCCCLFVHRRAHPAAQQQHAMALAPCLQATGTFHMHASYSECTDCGCAFCWQVAKQPGTTGPEASGEQMRSRRLAQSPLMPFTGCHTRVGAAAAVVPEGAIRTIGLKLTGRSRLPPTLPLVPGPAAPNHRPSRASIVYIDK